jgi:Tfp pilus assembly protein PilX
VNGRTSSQLAYPRRHRRGTILIVTIVVCFALAGSVIALCRSMRVEMQASANEAASIEASAVERGAEQYVLALLTDYKDQLRSMSEDEFAAVPVARATSGSSAPSTTTTRCPSSGSWKSRETEPRGRELRRPDPPAPA